MRKKKRVSIPLAKGEITLLASDAHVQGDIRFAGNLEIEGKVTGNILMEESREARLRIAPGGVVQGDIYVSHIIVSGRVEGSLHSTGQIELTDGSVVEGNLHYRLLEVEKGAVVNGNFIREQPPHEQETDNNVEVITAIR